MKRGAGGHFLSTPSCPTVPSTLGVTKPKDFWGPPTRAPQDEACGKGLVIALDLPESWHQHGADTTRNKEPSPISAEQEEGGDVRRPPGTVLDHLHVEAVIVNCVVRDDHCPPAVLLDHPGLGEEGAAPGRGDDETKGTAGAKLPLPQASP